MNDKAATEGTATSIAPEASFWEESSVLLSKSHALAERPLIPIRYKGPLE